MECGTCKRLKDMTLTCTWTWMGLCAASLGSLLTVWQGMQPGRLKVQHAPQVHRSRVEAVKTPPMLSTPPWPGGDSTLSTARATSPWSAQGKQQKGFQHIRSGLHSLF